VVGCSVAFHLARLGAGRVTVLERRQVGAGTTAQSSGILRTHYSVIQNVELALASWQVFKDFAGYLQDEEASAGLVRCGYLIASPDGPTLAALRSALDGQRAKGITVSEPAIGPFREASRPSWAAILKDAGANGQALATEIEAARRAAN
jgi:sarcosine oxidase subunit beta